MLKIPTDTAVIKAAFKRHEKAFKVLDDVLADLAKGVEINKRGKNRHVVRWVAKNQKNTLGKRYYAQLIKARGANCRFCALKPGELHDVCKQMNEWEARLRKRSGLRRAKKVVEELFNYDCFGKGLCPHYDADRKILTWKSHHDGWSAWQYLSALNIRSCVYCNAETVFAIEITNAGKPRKKRSAFDHFYSRRQYPFAGVTLCNLVPACTRCNTNIKGDRELEFGHHTYPYEDSFHDGVRFVIAYAPGKDVARFREEDVSVALVRENDTEVSAKAARSAEFFCLKDVYDQLHRIDALVVMQREVLLSESYLAFLRSKYPGIELSVVDRVINGMSINPADIMKHNLSKLTYDIVRQFRVEYN